MKGAIIVGIQQANWPCTEHCLVPTFPSLLLEMGSGNGTTTEHHMQHWFIAMWSQFWHGMSVIVLACRFRMCLLPTKIAEGADVM